MTDKPSVENWEEEFKQTFTCTCGISNDGCDHFDDTSGRMDEAIEHIRSLRTRWVKESRVEERIAELHAVFVRLRAVPTSEELNNVLGYINERMEKALKESHT